MSSGGGRALERDGRCLVGVDGRVLGRDGEMDGREGETEGREGDTEGRPGVEMDGRPVGELDNLVVDGFDDAYGTLHDGRSRGSEGKLGVDAWLEFTYLLRK